MEMKTLAGVPTLRGLGRFLLKQIRISGNPLQDVLEKLEAETINEAILQEPRQKDAGLLLGYSPQNLSNTKRRLKEKGFWPTRGYSPKEG